MFCPQCGNQLAEDANFCSSCGRGVAQVAGRVYQTRILRPRSPRLVAGVCSGIALYYGWDLTLVRILCVVFACLTSGLGVLAYLAAWVMMPDAPYALPAGVPGQGSAI